MYEGRKRGPHKDRARIKGIQSKLNKNGVNGFLLQHVWIT